MSYPFAMLTINITPEAHPQFHVPSGPKKKKKGKKADLDSMWAELDAESTAVPDDSPAAEPASEPAQPPGPTTSLSSIYALNSRANQTLDLHEIHAT